MYFWQKFMVAEPSRRKYYHPSMHIQNPKSPKSPNPIKHLKSKRIYFYLTVKLILNGNSSWNMCRVRRLLSYLRLNGKMSYFAAVETTPIAWRGKKFRKTRCHNTICIFTRWTLTLYNFSRVTSDWRSITCIFPMAMVSMNVGVATNNWMRCTVAVIVLSTCTTSNNNFFGFRANKMLP